MFFIFLKKLMSFSTSSLTFISELRSNGVVFFYCKENYANDCCFECIFVQDKL